MTDKADRLPITPERFDMRHRNYIKRAPVDQLDWEPSDPHELGEGLATLIHDIPRTARSWFWGQLTQELMSAGAPPKTALVEAIRGMDLHVSMFPLGTEAYNPDIDDPEFWVDGDEEGDLPPHLRDFRHDMIRRPDLPLSGTNIGVNIGSNSGKLPMGTAELTAMAYSYGADVPDNLVGTVWNRALTLVGDVLTSPSWIYDPAEVGYHPEGVSGNLGHPLNDETPYSKGLGNRDVRLKEHEEGEQPMSEWSKLTRFEDTVGKQVVQLQEGLRLNEAEAILEELEDDYLPYDDEDPSYDEDEEWMLAKAQRRAEKGSQAFRDAYEIKSKTNFLQQAGLAAGKMIAFSSARPEVYEAMMDLAVDEFLELWNDIEMDDPSADELLKDLGQLTSMPEFRFFVHAFADHVYRKGWKNPLKEKIESVLRAHGFGDKEVNRIHGKINRNELFGAQLKGTPQERIAASISSEGKEQAARKVAEELEDVYIGLSDSMLEEIDSLEEMWKSWREKDASAGFGTSPRMNVLLKATKETEGWLDAEEHIAAAVRSA